MKMESGWPPRISKVAKTKNIIPSQQLNVALPLPSYTQLSAHLFSVLEGRVPHGAYSRFITERIREYFASKHLDLAPFTRDDPGVFVVSGTPEAIEQLEKALKGEL